MVRTRLKFIFIAFLVIQILSYLLFGGNNLYIADGLFFWISILVFSGLLSFLVVKYCNISKFYAAIFFFLLIPYNVFLIKRMGGVLELNETNIYMKIREKKEYINHGKYYVYWFENKGVCLETIEKYEVGDSINLRISKGLFGVNRVNKSRSNK